MAARKAASVFPEPVGAATRTWRPALIAGHARVWAVVGPENVLHEPGVDGGMKQIGRGHPVEHSVGGEGCKARQHERDRELRGKHGLPGYFARNSNDRLDNEHVSPTDLPPLAFVDVETTGVDPRINRITEVGVVTVDGRRSKSGRR